MASPPRAPVREYWKYDPTGDYLEPTLQGLELSAGEYRRLPGRELADGTPALASGVLGLELRLSERGRRFHDPETQDLPNLAETDDAWRPCCAGSAAAIPVGRRGRLAVSLRRDQTGPRRSVSRLQAENRRPGNRTPRCGWRPAVVSPPYALPDRHPRG